ncbi:integumentary mucin C.1-like [Phlebotomus argentipes]|uniref:integumentary mucin C.1-like n=1 Tax=Phlebotomus argentipes TaxID=94469 RepID=UPI002892DFAC|nr:integumentary mucin C.1-like [Phlebotomus argentipes]
MASVLPILAVLLLFAASMLSEETPPDVVKESKHLECIPFFIGCAHFNRFCKFGYCVAKQTVGGSCDFKTPCRIDLACVNSRCKRIRKKNKKTITTTTQPTTSTTTPLTTTPSTTTSTTTTTTTTMTTSSVDGQWPGR